eukprot:255486_1
MGYNKDDCVKASLQCVDCHNINEVIDILNMNDNSNTLDKSLMPINQSIESKQKQLDVDDAIQYLSNMGFSIDVSLDAFINANYDIEIALESLFSNNESNSPNKLLHKATKLQMCQTYNEIKVFTIDDMKMNMVHEDCNMCTDTVSECQACLNIVQLLQQYIASDDYQVCEHDIDILNDFNHVLYHHNGRDNVKYIFEQCGQCNRAKCDIQSNIDRIHCYFIHSYQIKDGKKLTTINMENNRYMNQLKPTEFMDCKPHYSFGQRFYYWEHFKNLDEGDPGTKGKYKFSDLYIGPTFDSFKEELLKNDLVILTKEQWQNEYNKAFQHSQTHYCKKMLAGFFEDFNSEALDRRLYGISPDSAISINHLISIIVYCGYTELSFKFSETFRKLENKTESLDLFKK